MNKYIKGIVLAVLVVGMQVVATSNVHAALDVNISGNGADSANDGDVHIENQTTVVQENDVDITNDVTHEANTGANEVTNNTGSDVAITTGDIHDETIVENQAGDNTVLFGPCYGCGEHVVNLDVSDNGADSATDMDLSITHETDLQQTNTGSITNAISSDLNTGNNVAGANTNAEVSIVTGDIDRHSETNNTYGSNTGVLGGFAGDVAVEITNNGSGTEVSVDISFQTSNNVRQDNDFDVVSKDHAAMNTGGNTCAKTTGGDCYIATGSINADSSIANVGGRNDVHIGGPVFAGDDDADPVDDTDVDPTTPTTPVEGGTDHDVDPSDEVAVTDEEDSNPISDLVEDVLEAVVPTAHAADETVLGATQLPMTGLGTPMHVGLTDIMIGLYVLLLGLFMRRLSRHFATVEGQN